jgi:ribosomal protein S18 acetylase RimI-like enzyme
MPHPKINFRTASEADIPFLVRLREATMRAHVEKADGAYEEAAQLRRVMDRFDCAQIVVIDGRDAGLLKVDRRYSPWMLMQIQLAPAFQRQGIGEKLLRQLLAEAKANVEGVTLKVFKRNPAKKLYERVGFCVTREDERSFYMHSL